MSTIATKNTTKDNKKIKKGTSFWKDVRKGWQLYVLFALPFLYLLIFKYYPMYGAIIAFKDFNPVDGIFGSPWVGFEHIINFVQSYEFTGVIKNTLIISIYQLIAGFPFPIILALMLTYVYRSKFKKSVQMITYAPHFISVVVMVGIIIVFLETGGPINQFIGLFGIGPINFMGEPSLFSSIYVWSGIWQGIGFASIIYLAALSGVSPELHEAAIMDGANKLRRIWHIDLPSILPMIIMLVILDMGNVLDIGFQKVLLMQNSLNISSSQIIDTYVYKVGLVAPIPQFSYAAAIGLFKAIIGLMLIWSANKLAKKLGQESLW